jgi:hypothetical protein
MTIPSHGPSRNHLITVQTIFQQFKKIKNEKFNKTACVGNNTFGLGSEYQMNKVTGQ